VGDTGGYRNAGGLRWANFAPIYLAESRLVFTRRSQHLFTRHDGRTGQSHQFVAGLEKERLISGSCKMFMRLWKMFMETKKFKS